MVFANPNVGSDLTGSIQESRRQLAADLTRQHLRARLLGPHEELHEHLHTRLGAFDPFSRREAPTVVVLALDILEKTSLAASGRHWGKERDDLLRSCFGRVEAVRESFRSHMTGVEPATEPLRLQIDIAAVVQCFARIQEQGWAVEKQLGRLAPIEWRQEPAVDPQVRERAVAAAGQTPRPTTLDEGKPAASLRNQAAIALLESWLREDSTRGAGDWERVKAELDRDRPSARKLFP